MRGFKPHFCKTKTPTTNVVGVFLAEDEGFDLIKELPPSSWRQTTVHRTVVFRWVRIRMELLKQKPQPQMWSGFFWQRMRDSNPRKRSQSPVCYRYTNPLNVKHGYYYIQTSRKVKNFFRKFSTFLLVDLFCPVMAKLFPQLPPLHSNTTMIRYP